MRVFDSLDRVEFYMIKEEASYQISSVSSTTSFILVIFHVLNNVIVYEKFLLSFVITSDLQQKLIYLIEICTNIHAIHHFNAILRPFFFLYI